MDKEENAVPKYLETIAVAGVAFYGSMAAGQIPEEFQSPKCKMLFNQISTHPETDAMLAWRKGDRRFYQWVGLAPIIPFEEGHPTLKGAFTDKVKSTNGVKTLQGLNDFGSSPDCLGFQKSATNYAPRYNSTILEISVSPDFQRALAKAVTRKSRP